VVDASTCEESPAKAGDIETTANEPTAAATDRVRRRHGVDAIFGWDTTFSFREGRTGLLR